MSKAPAFQFYPVDFISDINVQLMTCEERGAYITLLCHEWIEEGLPIDDESLAVLSGARERWAEIKHSVMRCFRTTGGKKSKAVNPRLALEREKLKKLRAKRGQSGAIGNKIRWGKDLPDRKCDEVAMNLGSQKIALQSSVSSLQSLTPISPESRSVAGDDFQSSTAKFNASLDADLCTKIREAYHRAGNLQKVVLDRNTKEGIALAAAMIHAKEITLEDLESAIRACFRDPENAKKFGLRGVLNNLSKFLTSASPPASGSPAPSKHVEIFEGDCPGCGLHQSGMARGMHKCQRCGKLVLLGENRV